MSMPGTAQPTIGSKTRLPANSWSSRVPIPALVVWILGATFFFRQPLFSGFDSITGDSGDSRLIIYLHEHWVQVLQGNVSWRDPAFFFPTRGVLGYSDTFVLNEIFYAPLRLLGLDQFVAYEWTLILLTLVGFLGAYALCLRILRDHRILCALLAATSAFSNMLYVQAGHSQLYSVHWLPLILLLVIRAVEGRRAPRLAALLAGLMTGLLFLSTYYVAWFAVLCGVIALILFGWLGGAHRAGPAAWRATLARYLSRLTCGAVGLLVGLVPFAVLYLPTLGSAGRSLGAILQNAPEPIDILNTGQRNYGWGPLTRTVFDGSPRLSNGELGFGLTPIPLALLVTATIRFRRGIRTSRSRWNRAALTTCIVSCVAILLPMKIFSVVSAWVLVWFLVPGSSAIRATDRIGVIAGLALPLVVAFLLADVLRETSWNPAWRSRVIAAATVVLILLAVEQTNVGRNAGIDRPAELSALAAVPLPPPGCRTFYLTVHRRPAQPAYESSIDAMLIAQHIGVPTINGFSGQFPAGYGSATDPSAPDYAAAVHRWITEKGLTSGVCRYDETAHTWSPVVGR